MFVCLVGLVGCFVCKSSSVCLVGLVGCFVCKSLFVCLFGCLFVCLVVCLFVVCVFVCLSGFSSSFFFVKPLSVVHLSKDDLRVIGLVEFVGAFGWGIVLLYVVVVEISFWFVGEFSERDKVEVGRLSDVVR